MPPRRKKPTRRSGPTDPTLTTTAGPPAAPAIEAAIDPSLLQGLPTTTTELITADGAPQDFTIDTQARNWINARANDELARLTALGASATLLAVSNFGIVIDEDDGQTDSDRTAVNRIEIKSTFDFSRIAQLLVSDPIDYPHRTAYKFVHVVLIPRSMRSQGPMLVPYLYDSELTNEQGRGVPNNLDHWLLINQAGGRARHDIELFVDVVAPDAEQEVAQVEGASVTNG